MVTTLYFVRDALRTARLHAAGLDGAKYARLKRLIAQALAGIEEEVRHGDEMDHRRNNGTSSDGAGAPQ